MRFQWILLSALFLTACAPLADVRQTRIDNIPMYGQPDMQRPAELKRADEEFIASVLREFPTREIASKVWAKQAEQFLEKNNLDFAMRRYNQAWLLDPENYEPYWGFARVMLERGETDKSLRFLEKAHMLIDDTYQEVALLSDIGTAWRVKAMESKDRRAEYFAKANAAFEESTTLDAEYANSWRRWAFSLYDEGRYIDSWQKVDAALERGAKFPPAFLEALRKTNTR